MREEEEGAKEEPEEGKGAGSGIEKSDIQREARGKRQAKKQNSGLKQMERKL